MHRIGVIGAGYVGLVTAACLAELGNAVSCIDSDAEKIALLRAGTLPFFEPGLLELVLRNHHGGRLRFADSPGDSVRASDIIFIAVGTPMAPDGQADLRQVRAAALDIAAFIDGPRIIVNKSTVPVQTADYVADLICKHTQGDHAVCVVSNPEFLREGTAIADFMRPDRIVIGVSDAAAENTMRELYAPLQAPILVTDARTAEMIKYTANAFLAAKISFVNEIANICEAVDANIKDVISGAGSDKRIGVTYMNPGLGFGGSCLPKDVLALHHMAQRAGVAPRILDAIMAVNRSQVVLLIENLEAAVGSLGGKRIGLLGLAFKANTDDIRESPAITVARRLCENGAIVRAHDPAAVESARALLGDSIAYVSTSYEAANDADALVVATDWNEYKHIDFAMLKKLMAVPILVDGRGLYDRRKVEDSGLIYVGLGDRRLMPALR
ncbi:MAG: UDP-glucose/GDP-mannose dehydrogenase family protein [Candidatus Eremiobacteraeota bacterium]|nr:UDP-glucose/GDP-mannose dehydrogenase family protein [Candidatus Eremiobacteraeota bacterium]MBC5828340.1 UDP-glucose/GDP-mannose dehydrogenase family protein [Candidatus Eremiobacteraeota bacterium]